MADQLVSMLEARSVAVVGASPRPGSFGAQMMQQLVGGGFDGAVYPVNPNHAEILGLPCLDSIADLPDPVDLVVLGVPDSALEEQLGAAAAGGSRSAVIFGTCYEPPATGKAPLTERLASIARAAGMALCGGNGMGFLNVERRLRACGFHQPEGLEPGGITFISHSGSAFSAMLHNDRGLSFNLVVSTGLELVTSIDEYMDYALGLESTKAVAVFMEAVRAPGPFRRALGRAEERGTPVVALKVGRTSEAKRMVVAHSGALAGDDAAFEALFDAHGVLRVDSLDQLCDTLELLMAERRAGPGGLAAIHDSGGERAHLIDTARATGVRLASISDGTRDRLGSVLEPGLLPVNPLDAWGTGNRSDEIFAECMRILLSDPDTAALALCVDLTTEELPGGYTGVARSVFDGTDKPVVVLSNMAAAVDRRDAGILRRAGIPVLEGTWNGLAALRHLFDWRDHRARPPLEPLAPGDPGVRDRWRRRLVSREPFGEADGLALLFDYGIPVVAAEVADTVDEAVTAAERIGWPVALKTAVPGRHHKSRVGGVVLGVASEPELRHRYADLARRLGPRVLLAAMASPGEEFAIGMVNDAQFGPVLMVAAGGVGIERAPDRVFVLPPIDDWRAQEAIRHLSMVQARKEPYGFPGTPTEPLAHALARLSVLASDVGDLLAELDVNPVIVASNGCVAVDALVVRKSNETDSKVGAGG